MSETKKPVCYVVEPGETEKCGGEVVAHGMCAKHNAQLRRGRLGAKIRDTLPPGESAEVTVRCSKKIKAAVIAEAKKRTTPIETVSPSDLWREAMGEWLKRRGVEV